MVDIIVNKSIYNDLSKKFRDIQDRMELNNIEMAELLKVSEGTVRKYRDSKRGVPFDVFINLIEELNINPKVLLYDVNCVPLYREDVTDDDVMTALDRLEIEIIYIRSCADVYQRMKYLDRLNDIQAVLIKES